MSSDEIIILMMVTYNRLDLTKLTLDSIKKTITIPFNFIIVDNGSTDGTIEFLKDSNNLNFDLMKNCELIFNETNKGIAKGRNQALKKAVDLNTEWFVTIDNDVLLPTSWLTNCINTLKANPAYGIIGVSFENVKYPIVNLNGFEFEHKERGNCGTACMVFNKKLQKMIGYFNTTYELYGEDDANYNFRARVAGFKIGHILDHGTHIGEGENDMGKYREFKDDCRQKNLEKFYTDCKLYASRKKAIYIPYKD